MTGAGHAFAAALLDPARPVPDGWSAWNGSDPAVRFAVYRNNVVHSLVTVLADSFPVVRQWVGESFFQAMARCFVVDEPPRSPLMHRYGAPFADWLAGFEPATALPGLADLARLEWARLLAFHAADAAPLDAAALAAVLHDPERLAASSLRLHPSLTIVRAPHAVVSLWRAHQVDENERDRQLGRLRLDVHEAAWVFRDGDDALVLPQADDDAALAGALAAGEPLATAVAAHPQADVAGVLAQLIHHRLLIGLHDPAPMPDDPPKPFQETDR